MTGLSAASAKNFVYYATDFFRILCITQTSIAEFIRVGFEVSHTETEERARQTEMMLIHIAVSAACAATAVAANIHYGRKTEERLFRLLTPPFLFFLMDLFSGPETMSLEWFVGLTVFSWVAAYIFSSKPSPIPQEQQLILLPSSLKALDLPAYPTATMPERCLNVARVMQMAIFSFAAFSTLMIREFSGETKPLAFWNYEILVVASILPGFVGYRLTDDPKFARGFAALPVRFFEDFSFVYAALSGWFALALSRDNIIENRMLYIHICAIVSFVTALFSAGKTDFDPQKIHEKNEHLIENVKQIPDYLDEKRRNAVEACEDFRKMLSRCRDSFVNALPNPRKWCSADVGASSSETVSLV
ncbi:MAG: hypothetical protein Q8L78_05755 [Coxiellaceae bacterium]|nr:hypothetical protein [Coxiellaceae bacterium]